MEGYSCDTLIMRKYSEGHFLNNTDILIDRISKSTIIYSKNGDPKIRSYEKTNHLSSKYGDGVFLYCIILLYHLLCVKIHTVLRFFRLINILGLFP